MDVNTYRKSHGLPYEGKHKKRWYRVQRMFVPNGNIEEIQVLGLDEAKAMVFGCWDYSIVSAETGEVIY